MLYWWRIIYLNLYFIKFELEVCFEHSYLHEIKIRYVHFNTLLRQDKISYIHWISPISMWMYLFNIKTRLMVDQCKTKEELWIHDLKQHKTDNRWEFKVYCWFVRTFLLRKTSFNLQII